MRTRTECSQYNNYMHIIYNTPKFFLKFLPLFQDFNIIPQAETTPNHDLRNEERPRNGDLVEHVPFKYCHGKFDPFILYPSFSVCTAW